MTNPELELFFENNFEKIYKSFYRRTLSKEIAEDLTSETFLIFVENSNKDNIENGKAYIFGIARNVFLRYLTKKYKDGIPAEFFEDKIGESDIGEVIEEINLEEFALKYISQLPEKQQVILRMRLIEKMSLNEICEKTGKDMNYVRTTQKRGIKTLRYLLECTQWKT